MGAPGFEPGTYALKGQLSLHKYLSPLYLHCVFGVNNQVYAHPRLILCWTYAHPTGESDAQTDAWGQSRGFPRNVSGRAGRRAGQVTGVQELAAEIAIKDRAVNEKLGGWVHSGLAATIAKRHDTSPGARRRLQCAPPCRLHAHKGQSMLPARLNPPQHLLPAGQFRHGFYASTPWTASVYARRNLRTLREYRSDIAS
jgi:hypothetical protein